MSHEAPLARNCTLRMAPSSPALVASCAALARRAAARLATTAEAGDAASFAAALRSAADGLLPTRPCEAAPRDEALRPLADELLAAGADARATAAREALGASGYVCLANQLAFVRFATWRGCGSAGARAVPSPLQQPLLRSYRFSGVGWGRGVCVCAWDRSFAPAKRVCLFPRPPPLLQRLYVA